MSDPLTLLVGLFVAGVVIGLGIEVARVLLELGRIVVDAVVHAIRWHVYRPLVRRYYLRRHDRDLDRHLAMLRHPAGKGSGDAHNHTLS